MSNPEFGVSVVRTGDEPRPAVEADFSTAGFVLTAPDADPVGFPLDTAVRINTADPAALEALAGSDATTGSAHGQIETLQAQLGGLSAEAVIVRVDPGVDLTTAQTAIIDGLDILAASPAETGITPRLLAVPGFTWQQDDPATANPVVTKLAAIAPALEAHVFASGPHTTLQAFNDWRETFASEDINPIETWVKYGTGATAIDSVAAFIGMQIAADAANRGVPASAPANLAVQGIVGASRPIPFSITDGATEGQQILAADGGIVLKGERGVSSAIADAGFYGISYATAAEDDLWRFSNVKRLRQYIELTMRRTIAFYLGKRNVTPRTRDLILQTMQGILRDLMADGHLLDYAVHFEADKNSPENLRLGRLRTGFRAEEPPTLRRIDIDSGRMREAFSTAFGDVILTS